MNDNINPIPLLRITNLKKYFKTPSGNLHAVDDVTMSINRGKTMGVVGESGCGKTTLGRTVLRLIEPTSGEIIFDGKDIMKLGKSGLLKARKDFQIIFQDPYSSLNPRLTVYDLIAEPLIVNKVCQSRTELRERVMALMETVELSNRFTYVYPHELDGGRRQRIGIARALALRPKFIVCDEPVSALDVSVQAQIINLMMDIQEEMGLTFMFISHNLSVVRHISHDITVMYLGECVEIAPSDELFRNPLHPYTRALMDAIPVPNLSAASKKRKIIQGEVTNPVNPAPGCRFAPRCPHVRDECTAGDVALRECSPGHYVKCIR